MMIRAATWTPLEFTKTVRARTHKHPQKIGVNGTHYAVFWDATKNVPAIVHDTCTHRGASLSAGGVVDGNCVRCKYHGRPTKALPIGLHDANGILWLNDGPCPLDSPTPPDSWEFHEGAGQRIFEYSRSFDGCNPILLVENTLDFAHLDTVHAFHLVEGRPDVTIHSGGYHGKATYRYTSKVFDLAIENEYIGPWCSCLRFIFDGRQAFTIHFAVRPEGTRSATLLVRVTRGDHKWLGWLGDKLYLGINELPLVEDRYIVQNTDPTQWSANRLTSDDAFLKEYRAFMKACHPDILARYVE
jgi:phenylpropionate dioxygenase-like ring-hydroxylating dioxygenase large terminal subunit